MTLAQYIKKRNGVALGGSNSLRNMLYRSLGANNFSAFWNFWNPVFGYYLGRWVFKPLKKFLHPVLALLFTFLACGLLHDAVTLLTRGSVSFLFSFWFLLMGTGVVISKSSNYNLSAYSWWVRAFSNLMIIGVCFLAATYLRAHVIFFQL